MSTSDQSPPIPPVDEDGWVEGERSLPCAGCDCCEAESCEFLLCMDCPCHQVEDEPGARQSDDPAPPCPHCGRESCLLNRRPVVTPSQADRQPPASSSEAKGGLVPVAPDETKQPDSVTHHKET